MPHGDQEEGAGIRCTYVRKVLGPFGETPPCRLALDGQEVGVP